MTFTRKRLIIIGIVVFVLAAVIYGFWPDPVAVEVATAERGAMQVEVEEEGETEAAERYVMSAPSAAVLEGVEVEAGEEVEAGQALATLQAPPASVLDVRSRAEARSRVEAAEAGVEQAERQVEAAEAVAEQAAEERQRVEQLFEQNSATRQTLERAIAEELQAQANLESARSGVASARAELASARAALEPSEVLATREAAQDVLRAPTAGRILTVHRRSGGLLSPGEAILEVGDTEQLEVHVDVLSQDALRIRPGMRVLLDQWGGEEELEAVVDRVELQGETTVSALGVEEQRVTVVALMHSPAEEWNGLGSGYRVLARFMIWEEDEALQVPTSALFRTEEGWAVFVVENGQASRREVAVGEQAGLNAQVLDGLDAGEEVIVHPANEVADGVRVRARDS